jgi:hypothetical protein
VLQCEANAGPWFGLETVDVKWREGAVVINKQKRLARCGEGVEETVENCAWLLQNECLGKRKATADPSSFAVPANS